MRPALPIAVTLGDACGIGPEIVLKAHLTRAKHNAVPPLVVYGDVGVLQRQAQRLGLPITPQACAGPDAALLMARPGALSTEPFPLPVIPCSDLPTDLPIGRVDARAGAAAHAAIARASRDALAGHVAAVVTAPIHKEALAAAGVRHPGHTELLAELAGVEHVRMMLANDELRTLLVTLHLPLRAALDAITYDSVLTSLRFADQGLRQLGVHQPRIAVAGLNPHAGEHGLMGGEEQTIIAPAIAAARAQGIAASGPWPGDTVFMRARGFREFDLVVAMYHDQGLIPLKYLGLDQGVNITVGLPFIRTSVDHGTAFDIAGRGEADPASLLAALRMAEQLALNRSSPPAAVPSRHR